MDKCSSHGGCKEGYIGVDFGSTFTSGSFAFPDKGEYSIDHVARITPAASYLDIVRDAAGGRSTELRYPPPDRPEIPGKIMEAPKVSLMDPNLRRIDEIDMFNDVLRAWNDIRFPNDYTPSALFLEGYFGHVLKRFWDAAGQNKRPAVILTYPSGFSEEELCEFKKAAKAAKIEQYACSTCKITYLKEGEAAALSVLKDHYVMLQEAHKGNDAIIVADYGGVTDDIVTFRFDCRLGGNLSLPGAIVNTECRWTGAWATAHAFKTKLIETARDRTGRKDEEFIAEIQRDLDKACRMWARLKLPKYTALPMGHQGFECSLGGRRVFVRREVILEVIDKAAEAKADVLLAMIKAEAKAPKFLALLGGYSKCKALYNQVEYHLSEKLAAQVPPIPMPQILNPLPDKDPQLSVSRGTILSKIPTFLSKYAPSVNAPSDVN